ncbi:type IV pilus biogenesis protein PilM [Jeotgalibaca ciconiae]|uniref:Pilus assembly protein PilM n=1 Tax=Jeotgalibaca ciconiae TaxID=2496265 RepID=A0A3Q9BJA7_9LACT|nr:pilus assembly protein PilM [Jeotgalibaca ciconiae]AZP03671.1 hypothetical protein EJN90_02725 [Jeotgalibaca ciconiae]
MIFKKKPILFFEFLERRIRYIAVDSQSHSIIEKEEILFDTEIVYEGKIMNPSLVVNRLKALVAEKKWKNSRTSILLPDDFVIIREEKVPSQLTPSEIRDYIRLHMNHLIRTPFKQTNFHFEVLEKEATEQTILLMLYSNEVIMQYESLLEDAGLKPVVADISSLSLYRIIEKQQEIGLDEEKHVLVLQWSPVNNCMSVFHQGMPKFIRHSRSARLTDLWNVTKEGEWKWKGSEESLHETISDMLDILERFLEFYRYSVMDGKEGVTDIFLSGDFPNIKNLQHQLSKRFYLPIHELGISEEVGAAFLPLYGLSLKEKKNVVQALKKGKGEKD